MTGRPTVVHVPYTLERDADGIWCAHAWLGVSGGANGVGASRAESVADLTAAVQLVLDEDGIPEELRNCLEVEVG
jgi:hypothetical protein